MFSYKTLDNTSIEIIHKAFIDAFSDYQVKMEMPIWKFEQMLLRRGYVPEMSIGAFINKNQYNFINNHKVEQVNKIDLNQLAQFWDFNPSWQNILCFLDLL